MLSKYQLTPTKSASQSYVGGILLGVAFVNSFIEMYQFQKSASILDSFLDLIPAKCSGLRGGQLRIIPTIELVPGDLVFLRMGDKVPADVRIFYANDLKIDQSALTGESFAIEKRIHSTEKNPLEATNLCFNGTLVVSGEGYAIVTRTGDSTILGQIADMTVSQPRQHSPLSAEIQRFCKLITIIAILTALLFFIYSMLVFRNLNNSLLFAIGVLVAWVPQGLPATVTLLLSIAAQRMANQQVLVKNLLSVETLGAITLMATDKTGTLTRNQMTVTKIWTNGRQLSHHGSGLPSDAEDRINMDNSGVNAIVMISALCTRARFDRLDVPMEDRKVIGNPTEAALLRFAGSFVPNIDYVSRMLRIFCLSL
jgi:sodium/potassium-transporting ATPase subunit alpha